MVGATQGAPLDTDAFVAAYRATLPEVFAYLGRATTGDRALAEDLTSATYEAALVAWQQGNPDAVAISWLIGVARHKLIDRFRRSALEERKLALAHASDTGIDADDGALMVVVRDQLFGCVRQLAPLQRAAFALRYVDDLPVAEVAARLDRSLDATDSLLRRARAALRIMLEALEEGDAP